MPAPERFRLATIGAIATELKRLFRMGHAGEIAWQDATCAARVLRELRFCIEGGDIETRLSALEEALAARDGRPGTRRPRINGHEPPRPRL